MIFYSVSRSNLKMKTAIFRAIGRQTVFYTVFEHQLGTLLARFPPLNDIGVSKSLSGSDLSRETGPGTLSLLQQVLQLKM